MIWTIIHIVDILLWLIMAASVMYVCFFSFVSLFYRKERSVKRGENKARFLILYPAYHEDAVIVHSVSEFLRQEYPSDHFQLIVISDHMTDDTNKQLRQLPITLLTPVFDKSSKAKALQYAVESVKETDSYDHVVILDADNVVRTDFLSSLNDVCQQGYQAIQCHRCAKNSDNDIAILDGVSEEINNTIFRRAHNTIGLSSALIGSGMCFNYTWFKQHVGQLSSAVEDREMEALLMKEGIFIKFVNDIPVYDEKVSNSDNFQRQRLRWMTGQVQTLLLMLPYIPKAIIKGNINYIDKTIQQALIPRSILLVCTLTMALLLSACVSVWCLKWWILFGLFSLSLLIALPAQLRSRTVFRRLTYVPRLVGHMLSNLFKIDHKNSDFIHTDHGNGENEKFRQ